MISSSVTAAMAPPVRRTTSRAYHPSAGLPIASDFAIVAGLTGRTWSLPSAKAVATGEQPCRLRAGDPDLAVARRPAPARRADGTPCRSW